jgi:3-isopropylmalate dehydrogenase
MLFDWLGHRHQRKNFTQAARGIEAAMDAALSKAETRTADLGGPLGTQAFGKVVTERLSEVAEKLAK